MRIPELALAVLLAATGLASAADLAPDVSPNIDEARFGWTGAYAGGSVGYGWLHDKDKAPPPGFPVPLYDKGDDWTAALHAGYLYQYGSFVGGAEAEVSSLDITYKGFTFITIQNAYALKARAGWAIDRFLVSGHGGAVYTTTNYMKLKDWGWTAGVNVDYAVTDHLIVGAQYTHMGFKNFDTTQIDARIDLLSARVAYKF